MTENNLALEEYLEFIKQYKYHENSYIFTIGNRKILISYKEYVDENISIDLSDNDLYKISGNNYDGFIITVWR